MFLEIVLTNFGLLLSLPCRVKSTGASYFPPQIRHSEIRYLDVLTNQKKQSYCKNSADFHIKDDFHDGIYHMSLSIWWAGLQYDQKEDEIGEHMIPP